MLASDVAAAAAAVNSMSLTSPWAGVGVMANSDSIKVSGEIHRGGTSSPAPYSNPSALKIALSVAVLGVFPFPFDPGPPCQYPPHKLFAHYFHMSRQTLDSFYDLLLLGGFYTKAHKQGTFANI
jgi:hypothetical protein